MRLGLGSILDTYKYGDTLIVRYRYFAVFDTSRHRTSVLRYVGTSILDISPDLDLSLNSDSIPF